MTRERERELLIELTPGYRRHGWRLELLPTLRRWRADLKTRLFPDRCAMCGRRMGVKDFSFVLNTTTGRRVVFICRHDAVLVKRTLEHSGG